MKKMNRTSLKVTGLLALIISVGTATSSQAQALPAPVLSLQASNYDPSTGIWTDSSPSADDAGAVTTGGDTAATLVSNVTPNGSSAVLFAPAGSGSASMFQLSSTLTYNAGWTVFVYADQLATISGDGASTFVAGGANFFQYRLYQGKQADLTQAVGDGGTGTTLYPSGFNLFDVTASETQTGSFDLNSAPDGTNGELDPPSPNSIKLIGSNESGTGGEQFDGYIADIEIFNTILTPQQIAAEDLILTNEYAATPEPSTWALLLGGIGSLALLRRVRMFGRA